MGRGERPGGVRSTQQADQLGPDPGFAGPGPGTAQPLRHPNAPSPREPRAPWGPAARLCPGLRHPGRWQKDGRTWGQGQGAPGKTGPVTVTHTGHHGREQGPRERPPRTEGLGAGRRGKSGAGSRGQGPSPPARRALTLQAGQVGVLGFDLQQVRQPRVAVPEPTALRRGGRSVLRAPSLRPQPRPLLSLTFQSRTRIQLVCAQGRCS